MYTWSHHCTKRGDFSTKLSLISPPFVVIKVHVPSPGNQLSSIVLPVSTIFPLDVGTILTVLYFGFQFIPKMECLLKYIYNVSWSYSTRDIYIYLTTLMTILSIPSFVDCYIARGYHDPCNRDLGNGIKFGGINFASFFDFSIKIWNCFDKVVFLFYEYNLQNCQH